MQASTMGTARVACRNGAVVRCLPPDRVRREPNESTTASAHDDEGYQRSLGLRPRVRLASGFGAG